MDISIIQPDSPPPVPFAHSLSMVIKSFKGRKNVEVHLFRGKWNADQENDIDWHSLIAHEDCSPADTEGGRAIVMEAFSSEERDRIINYLKEQYSTRLSAITSTPLSFPVPAGLTGLSQLPPSKSVGMIDFLKIPSYPLDIPLKGLYDLSQHPPIVEE